ncbi:MAG TPA: hypothetical protein VD948_04830, partial [Rhodothermales bacterium]|nr:hypothetical protein [Rhodothermales bacterium]
MAADTSPGWIGPARGGSRTWAARRLVLAAGDVAALVLGWALGVVAGAPAAYGDVSGAAFRDHAFWLLVPGVVWLAGLYGAALYDLRRAARPIHMSARLLMGTAVVLALYPVLFFVGGVVPGLPQRAFTTRVIPLSG